MRKRVVFVMPAGSVPVTGGEKNMARLACGIDRQRYEAIALCRPGPLAEILQQAGIATAPLPSIAPVAEHLQAYLNLNSGLKQALTQHQQGLQIPCRPIVDALCGLKYAPTAVELNPVYAPPVDSGFHLQDASATPAEAMSHIGAGTTARWVLGRDAMRLRQIMDLLQPHVCVLDYEWDVLTGAIGLEGTRTRAAWYLQMIDPPRDYDATIVPRISIAMGGARACLEGRMRGILKRWLVYSGIDTDVWRPKDPALPRHDYFSNVPPDTVLIGMAGMLAGRKAQDVLIAACGELRRTHPKFKLYLFGEGYGGTEALEQLAQQCGVQDQVVFAGNRNDLPALLPHLDISVFLSRQESLSLALCEGMACGLATVCNDLPGFHEVLEQSDAARMVALDASTVAAALRAFMDDPALRHAYGARARERIKSRFTVRGWFESFQSALDA